METSKSQCKYKAIYKFSPVDTSRLSIFWVFFIFYFFIIFFIYSWLVQLHFVIIVCIYIMMVDSILHWKWKANWRQLNCNNIYIYIYIYIYIHTHTYTHIYTRIYIYTHTHIYTYIYTYMCVCGFYFLNKSYWRQIDFAQSTRAFYWNPLFYFRFKNLKSVRIFYLIR